MRITILGSGGSSGTPAVDFGWSKANPDDPRNRRLRPSVLVEDGDTTILVDTSPDLRQQLLNAEVQKLNAVLFTHWHADHLHGIDDLRPINRLMDTPIDIYTDADTLAVIEERFAYVLEPLADGAPFFYKPVLNQRTIGHGDRFTIGSIDITVMQQDHGHCTTLGFRFGDMAYSTDVVELPEDAFDMLAGVDTWIVGTLVDNPHPTHAHVDKAVGWMQRVKPRRGVLTHLSGLFDYETLNAKLPGNIEPAYDGLVLEQGQ